MKRIAVFNWGDISIHTYYIVEQLRKENLEIDLFVYTPVFSYKGPYLSTLLSTLRKTVNVIEIKCTLLERDIIKFNRLFIFLRRPSALACVNPMLPARTRKKFAPNNYSFVITIKQWSLYWLYKTNPHCLNKTIHYSLEAQTISDPLMNVHSCIRELIRKEEMILKGTRALLVQDRDRAEVLLNKQKYNYKTEHIYLPVSIPGSTITSKSDYLFNKLNIPHDKKIILYFGSIYNERKLEECLKAADDLSDEYVLVLHGEDNFSQLVKNKNRVLRSNETLAYDEIYKIISSATIGIAFYDNNWPNTRLTAFSSEKIARYLQAGVPFIAFKNESYIKLKKEFSCCELIEDFSEFKNAVETIMNDYNNYRKFAFSAYEKYYNIENTIKPLVEFIKN